MRACPADDGERGGQLVDGGLVGPPAERAAATDDELDAALEEALKRMSPSRAAAEVAAALNVPRKRTYARALELSK